MSALLVKYGTLRELAITVEDNGEKQQQLVLGNVKPQESVFDTSYGGPTAYAKKTTTQHGHN